MLQFAAMLGLAVYCVNVGYGFKGTGQRLGDFRFVSRVLQGPSFGRDPKLDAAQNRFGGTWLAALRVPLPRDFLLGIDLQRRDFEGTVPTFYRGAWRAAAPWYAYFYALAIKLPLGTLCLMGLAAAVSLRLPTTRAVLSNEFVLLAPAAAVLVAATAHSGLNSQVRYVLPAMPFLFVWAAKSAELLAKNYRLPRWLSIALMLWAVDATLRRHPHHLAYFNELSVWPTTSPPPLLDSNLDWGQDLLYLTHWLRAHPEARPLRMGYLGTFDHRDLGIESEAATDLCQSRSGAKPSPGWYAVGVGQLWGRKGEFALFRGREPSAVVGSTIYVYHVTE